jgi:RNAse (barnase) inhibitor barstar
MIEFHPLASSPTGSQSYVVRIPQGITNKEELLQCIAARLNFPEYFGCNWDALDECLADLSWLQTRKVYIWHDDIPLTKEPDEVRRYLQVLQGVQREPGRVQLRISFPQTARAELNALLT